MDVIWCLYHNFLTLFQKDICSLSLQEVPFTLLKMIRYDQKSSSSKLGERFSASFSQNVTFCPVWLENKVSEVSLELNAVWQSQCTCTHTTLIPGKNKACAFGYLPLWPHTKTFQQDLLKKYRDWCYQQSAFSFIISLLHSTDETWWVVKVHREAPSLPETGGGWNARWIVGGLQRDKERCP